VLLYNTFAFALQLPVGLIADKLRRYPPVAAAGCLLVVSAFFTRSYPTVATMVVGAGNALFHVGAGADIIAVHREKAGPLGLFVAPGALGVYIATITGRVTAGSRNAIVTISGNSAASDAVIPVVAVIILVMALFILVLPGSAEFGNTSQSDQVTTTVRKPLSSIAVSGMTGCLFAVVALRSLIGSTLSFEWKTEAVHAVALVVATMLGKAAGGYIADRAGEGKTASISLTLAALLFLFPEYLVTGITSVLLFNMTMPISLNAQAKLYSGLPGYAFGLLSFGLYIGWLPVQMGAKVSPEMQWLFSLAAVFSCVLLVFALYMINRNSSVSKDETAG